MEWLGNDFWKYSEFKYIYYLFLHEVLERIHNVEVLPVCQSAYFISKTTEYISGCLTLSCQFHFGPNSVWYNVQSEPTCTVRISFLQHAACSPYFGMYSMAGIHLPESTDSQHLCSVLLIPHVLLWTLEQSSACTVLWHLAPTTTLSKIPWVKVQLISDYSSQLFETKLMPGLLPKN